MEDLKYQIYDGETENQRWFGRFSSPWHHANYMVAHGWKNKGDATCSFSYQTHVNDPHTWSIPDDCQILVGHNFRFDLTWIWNDPSFKAFIERGGIIWCTQYAEYLMEGHDDEYQMNTLEQLSLKYGGTVKVDAVKAMWEDGKLTSEIPKDLLIDYLVGTEEEGRDGGDIGNTEKVYLAQIKRAEELGMMPIIRARMEGYLATTEMEVNGLKIDMSTAVKDMLEQQDKLNIIEGNLREMIPDVGIPEQVQFNFGSGAQVSALLFGGYVKYEYSDHYIDEDTGVFARTQVDVLHYIVEETGELVPEHTADAMRDVEGWEHFLKFKSGKKKGEFKTKKVKLPIGKLKKRRFKPIVAFPRQIDPLAEWEGKQTDALDKPIYSVGAEVIDCLVGEDNTLAQEYYKYTKLKKVLDTYYIKTTVEDGKITKRQGMLTFVKPDGIINHYLNHTSTITGRMSAKEPNCQNIPRGDTAIVKRMFTSRFENGVNIEADYSQLEVVVNGYLTKDRNLIRDLEAGTDFHCKHVALKNHIPYEEAYDLCKVQEIPKWKSERTKCKGYTFQSEYGAGIKSIAKSTGMTEEEVEGIKDAVAKEYPEKTAFPDEVVKAAIDRSAQPFTIKFPYGGYKTIKKGFYVSPTGTRYAFRSEDAPSWLRSKGIDQTFKPTKIKNYPTQGTGGEIMQVQLGILFRKCVAKGWWSLNPDSPALLVNTVHDCVWGDCKEEVHQDFGNMIKDTLSSVPDTYNRLFNIDVGVEFPVDVEYGRNMMEMSHAL